MGPRCYNYNGMYVIDDGVTLHKCSSCLNISWIHPTDQWVRWLVRGVYICPYCKYHESSDETNKGEIK